MRVRNKWATGLLLVVSGLFGCAPQVVGIYNSDQVKIEPKTFYVYGIEDVKSLSDAEKQLNKRLVDIINDDLEMKGLKKSSLADIYVSFMVNVHTSQETRETPINSYNYRYYNYNYLNPYNSSTQNYKEGVFIIDVKNQDNKLVWQGNKTFKLKSRDSVQEVLPVICAEVINSFDLNRL